MLRGKGGDTLKGKPLRGGGQGVSDGEDARVKDADDVPRIGVLDNFPLAGHHLLGLGEAHLPPALDMMDLHARVKFAGADAHEGDPVPVGLVHIGLYLEHKGREIRLLHGVNIPPVGFPWKRGGCHVKEVLQECLHAEVGQGGAEEYRRQLAPADQLLVELGARSVLELDLLLQLQSLVVVDEPGDLRVIDLHLLNLPLCRSLLCVGKELHLSLPPVVHAFEALARADRPVDGAGGDAQLALNVVQELKGVHGLPVHLVDKGKNGDVAHGADLEQLSRLGLHSLGGVDHHHSGVRRHQGPVGVLREVLMPRRVQDVDAIPVILKLQDRGGDRDTSLLLDLHPVRHGVLCSGLPLYASRLVDGSSVQQELLCQGGLSRIRVGNDGKSAAPPYLIFHLFCQFRHDISSPLYSHLYQTVILFRIHSLPQIMPSAQLLFSIFCYIDQSQSKTDLQAEMIHFRLKVCSGLTYFFPAPRPPVRRSSRAHTAPRTPP